MKRNIDRTSAILGFLQEHVASEVTKQSGLKVSGQASITGSAELWMDNGNELEGLKRNKSQIRFWVTIMALSVRRGKKRLGCPKLQ